MTEHTTARCTHALLYMPAGNLPEAFSRLEATFASTKTPVAADSGFVELLERWFVTSPTIISPSVAGLYFTGAQPGAYEELDALVIPTIGHLFTRDAAGNTPCMEWDVAGRQLRWQLFGPHRVVSELVQIWQVKSLT